MTPIITLDSEEMEASGTADAIRAEEGNLAYRLGRLGRSL